MRILQSTLLALSLSASLLAAPAFASEDEDAQSEAEAYAVSSYAALYNLSASRLTEQMNRNIIYFGTPAAYVGYLQSLKDSNLASQIEADQGVLTTEITDVDTVRFLDDAFLVRLAVRQTLTSKSHEMTTCFEAVSTIAENKTLNLGSSSFTNIGQPVTMANKQCEVE